MALVNVAQCDDDVEASQESDIAAFTAESDENQLVDGSSFYDLPLELQCHILRELHADDIRELKRISKQLKCLIERHWSRAFSILPPKIQIKILTETQMTSLEIRRLKLVSKDLKYLIERGGRHLTKQELTRCRIEEIVPGSFKVAEVNNCYWENISLEHFSRVFAHCHILYLHLDILNVTFDFCDQIQSFLLKNKITVGNLALLHCTFNNKEKVTIIDRLLRTTEASCLHIAGYLNKMNRFNKAFFWMSSVRKLEELSIHGQCRFRDDDLSAGNYRALFLRKCLLTEHGLRRILEEVLDCRRDIASYDFTLQKVIDVDRLLDGLPNIERTDEHRWNLRNSRDEIMELHIENYVFSCYTTAI